MGWVVDLRIPPRSDHLALVRLVVESTARIGAVLADRRIDDLRLAVSEACANAFDAQAAAASDAPIAISIEVDDKPAAVTVTVTDHAGGFAIEDVDPLPPATDPGRLRHERGLGISLMRSLVDELTFTPTGDGTIVRLVVRG